MWFKEKAKGIYLLFFLKLYVMQQRFLQKIIFCGAPIIVGREKIKNGKIQAVLINSSVSNVATGEQGIKNVHIMSKILAKELGIDDKYVFVSSTG